MLKEERKLINFVAEVGVGGIALENLKKNMLTSLGFAERNSANVTNRCTTVAPTRRNKKE
jgi:hypothetical protein